MNTIAVTRLYESYDDAMGTVRDLETQSVPQGDISLIANNADGRHKGAVEGAQTGAGAGAAVGTVLGGGAGLLAGLGLLAIPGVGPVAAAGWLTATAAGAAAGAGVGAASGGLIGSLTGHGVREDHAHIYAEGVRRGGTLVIARIHQAQRAVVQSIMERHHPVDTEARGKSYRESGWKNFDAAAAPYAPTDSKRQHVL